VVVLVMGPFSMRELDCEGEKVNARDIAKHLKSIDSKLDNPKDISHKLQDIEERLSLVLAVGAEGRRQEGGERRKAEGKGVERGKDAALDLLNRQIELRHFAHEQQKEHLQEYRDVAMGLQNAEMNRLNAWVIQATVLWWMYENTYQCPVDQRLGRNGDGGKWICNPDVFAASPCVLYSFGVKDDFSFEVESHERMGCKEHLYDPTINVEPVRNELRKYPEISIDKVGIEDNDNNPLFQRLSTLMRKNGDDYIDILKIDVEGAERRVFKDFFATHNAKMQELFPGAKPADYPIATIILVELHYGNGDQWPPKSGFDEINSWHEFFKLLEDQGYAIYHKEMNLYDSKGAEYAFVHTSYMEQLERELVSTLLDK